MITPIKKHRLHRLRQRKDHIYVIFIKRHCINFITLIMGSIFFCGIIIRAVAQEDRDPFVSIIDLEKQKFAARKNIDLSKIHLKGIIWSSKRAIAIINDELVMVGDDWQGFKVERIDKDSIRLNDGINSYDIRTEEGNFVEDSAER